MVKVFKKYSAFRAGHLGSVFIMLSGDYLDKPIMFNRHPVRNSQFMKMIRDVHSFFQEESLKIKNNQPVLLHTAILECVCVTLEIGESSVPATLKDCSVHVSCCVNTCMRCVI
jgi:hypothetical protein